MPAAPLLPWIQRAARLTLHLHGLDSRSYATPVGPLHAYEGPGQGTLPATVVLHGIGSAATQFGRVLLNLRPHVRRLLAPDLPGHGFSPPPEQPLTPERLFAALCELLDTWREMPLVLVGNSLGGALSLRYALAYPERVRALVLISPAGAQMSEDEWQALRDSFQLRSHRDARRFLRRLYHRVPLYMPAFASAVRSSFQSKAVMEMLASASAADLPAPEQLRALNVPTLLVWGRSERLLPPSSLAYFRRHLPAHTLIEEPEGFGHCPHIDDPGRLAQRVVEFVGKLA